MNLNPPEIPSPAQSAATHQNEAERKRLADEIAAIGAKKREEQEAKEEAERIAAAAPDRQKLAAYAVALVAVPLPDMATEEGAAFAEELREKTAGYARLIVQKANELSKAKKGQKREGELL